MTVERGQSAERLALALSDGGLQKMHARVLALFLFTDQDSLTMGEISTQLGISAGSVSAAVNSLLRVGLIERMPAPGSRREHYRMRDDAWPTLFTTQNAVTHTMLRAAESGLAVTAPDDPARRRLSQMRDFYQFMLEEFPSLLQRWHDRQAM